jgi:hypothetical protein
MRLNEWWGGRHQVRSLVILCFRLSNRVRWMAKGGHRPVGDLFVESADRPSDEMMTHSNYVGAGAAAGGIMKTAKKNPITAAAAKPKHSREEGGPYITFDRRLDSTHRSVAIGHKKRVPRLGLALMIANSDCVGSRAVGDAPTSLLLLLLFFLDA